MKPDLPIWMIFRVLAGCGLVVVVLALGSCRDRDPVLPVKLAEVNGRDKHIPDLPRKDALRIAVAAMVTPRETLEVYQQIVDYLGEKLGRPVELVQRKTYAEVNDLLRQRLVDVAFVCTQAYVEGKRDFSLELAAAPVIRGQPLYYSYIIVPRTSTARELPDLKGKAFAFSDPLSASGKLVPTYLLAQMDETPDTFFSNYIFTYAHSNSIKSVARGIVDGAAVDSLVWDYAQATDPTYTSRTKVIYRSAPMGAPPVVVHPDLEVELKAGITASLLGMHEDPEGKRILSAAMIDRFVVGDDAAYDVVREMLDFSGRNGVRANAPAPK